MRRRLFASCLGLQLRLAARRLPALLAMALVALAFGGTAALAGRALLSGRDFTAVTLAVASEDGDERVDGIVDMLTALQDVSAFAALTQTDAATAEALVRQGEAAVAVVLPAGFMDSVLMGENLSPRLVVDASRPLEAMLAVKLAESTTRMLARAQQGITFTLNVYDAAAPGEPPRSQVVQDINLRYAGFVLGRGSLFRTQVVNPTGALGVFQFYLLAAVLFFAVLSLPVLHRLYSLSGGWPARLRAGGCPLWMWGLASVAAGALALLPALALLLLGIALAGGGGFALALVPAVLVCALCLSAFGFLCCNTGSILSAVVLNFLAAAAGLVTFGGLVPAVLLPGPVAALGPFSPLGWMHTALAPLFGASGNHAALWLLAALAAALAGGCVLLCHRRERRLAP